MCVCVCVNAKCILVRMFNDEVAVQQYVSEECRMHDGSFKSLKGSAFGGAVKIGPAGIIFK